MHIVEVEIVVRIKVCYDPRILRSTDLQFDKSLVSQIDVDFMVFNCFFKGAMSRF